MKIEITTTINGVDQSRVVGFRKNLTYIQAIEYVMDNEQYDPVMVVLYTGQNVLFLLERECESLE